MIHEGATTDGMWNPGGSGDLRPCRRPAARAGAEDPALADRPLHQFILAGAYRPLRRGGWPRGREALRLFELPEVRKLGLSPKVAARPRGAHSRHRGGALEDMITGTPTPGESLHPFQPDLSLVSRP
jgi:hypothetical protein